MPYPLTVRDMQSCMNMYSDTPSITTEEQIFVTCGLFIALNFDMLMKYCVRHDRTKNCVYRMKGLGMANE
ncbi:Hypothetical predicted protein [Scomber scombrus]|uniref:Uncharacterized protein n=1 Tax=Scomber scombrus TaxID=13677 RepID=A0AAV1NTQ2_SCOSC